MSNPLLSTKPHPLSERPGSIGIASLLMLPWGLFRGPVSGPLRVAFDVMQPPALAVTRMGGTPVECNPVTRG